MDKQTYNSLSSSLSLVVAIIFIVLIVLLILHRSFCIWSGLSIGKDLLKLNHQLPKTNDQNEEINEKKKQLKKNVEKLFHENDLLNNISLNRCDPSKTNFSSSLVRRFSSSSCDSENSFIAAHHLRANILDYYNYELKLDRLAGDFSCFPGAAYGS